MLSSTNGRSSSTLLTAHLYWVSFSIFVITLHIFNVYLIILFMSANKTNIYKLDGKLYDYNQSVIIALDIENIMLIIYIINTVIVLLYIGKTGPSTSFHSRNPVLQSYF